MSTPGELYYDGKAIDTITAQLGNPERVAEIVEMMQQVFDSEMPGSRYYDTDQKHLAVVRSFSEGKYNLFPSSKYRRKEPVRRETEAMAVQPVEDEKPAADIDLTQYGLNIPLGTWLYILLSITGIQTEVYLTDHDIKIACSCSGGCRRNRTFLC